MATVAMVTKKCTCGRIIGLNMVEGAIGELGVSYIKVLALVDAYFAV